MHDKNATHIVVLDGYTLNPGDNPWDAVAALGALTVHDRTPADQVLERAADASIILTNKTPVTAAIIERLPKLRFISVLATGYNVVDTQAAKARGIPVSNVPVYGTDTVAQHVFAVLLTMCHQPTLHSEAVHRGEWAQHGGDFCFWKTPLIELVGLKMGIVGFGRIGRRVGELAHAFGMEVLAHDQFQGNLPAYQPFAWRGLTELFEEADVVTLHCPATDDNLEFVNRDLLNRMKRTAIFINSARGVLVNEKDMAEALNTGRIAGACLDVVSKEPIREDNPLFTAKNCLLTPHIAWATLNARSRLMATTAQNIAAFLRGKPINVVN